MLKVSEIFTSIQGESTYAGLLCQFIRLSGCNLRCSYCDTLYAQEFSSGTDMELDRIVQTAIQSGVNLVEITGGEPMTQKETPELCEKLIDMGFTVLVETNGSLPVSALPRKAVKILDCKTPSSGESLKMDFTNFSVIDRKDEIKFVLKDYEDYVWAKGIIEKYKLAELTPNILFSPVWGTMNLEDLASWIVRDRIPVRLNIQLHKIIWGPDKKGV